MLESPEFCRLHLKHFLASGLSVSKSSHATHLLSSCLSLPPAPAPVNDRKYRAITASGTAVELMCVCLQHQFHGAHVCRGRLPRAMGREVPPLLRIHPSLCSNASPPIVGRIVAVPDASCVPLIVSSGFQPPSQVASIPMYFSAELHPEQPPNVQRARQLPLSRGCSFTSAAPLLGMLPTSLHQPVTSAFAS